MAVQVREFPVLEFDPDPKGKIEPSRRVQGFGPAPARCVLTFYQAVLNRLRESGMLRQICLLEGDTGDHPVEVLDFRGVEIAVANPGLGAPSAAGMLELLIAMGARKVVACGHGGVLRADLARGSVVIPCCAIRQEGVSYQYLPPSREVDTDERVIKSLKQVLEEHHVPHEIGKTWTTDALFRETASVIDLRKREGAMVVEMEAAALMAVAKFRGITFGQYIGAGDDVSGDNWDPRYCPERASQKEKLFWLAVEACSKL